MILGVTDAFPGGGRSGPSVRASFVAVLDRPSRQTHIRDMAGTVTNELLLEHMKAMRAELAALAAQVKELRDRQTETHAAVVAIH